MNFFGIKTGGESTLSMEQHSLKNALLPEMRRAASLGYSVKELGQALADYWKRNPSETITTEQSVSLVKDPEKLIFNYRKLNNRNNRPSSKQVSILTSNFPKFEERKCIESLLSETLVVDAIPPLKFKGLLTLLKTSPETTPAQLLALRFKS